MPSAQVKVTVSDTKRVEAMLARLPIQMRETALSKGLSAAGRVVVRRAKQLVPKPGYPGDKKGKKALRETIGVVIRKYRGNPIAVVGPQYPAGAHGHLVEFGHNKPDGSRTTPKPFMRPAADQTKSEQQKALIRKIQLDIDKVAKRG